MGLSRTGFLSVFTADWQDRLKDAPERGMVAAVTIYDSEAAESTWVPGTGLVTVPSDPWFTGKARIQPIRNAQYIEGDRVQAVRVSLPIDGPFTGSISTGYVLEVTNGGLNPDNMALVYNGIETMDSSNPLERTLVFEVNYQAEEG